MKKLRSQLRKLMELDNANADRYLANFARELIIKIKQSQDNDYIFEQLDLLEEFVYKVPQETVEAVQFLTAREPTNSKVRKTPLGKTAGKSHKDIILKSIELLSHISYITPDEVLELTAQFSRWDDKMVKDKALEVVQKFAKYDYNVLTKSKIGYGAQRKILSFMLTWSPEERIRYLDFVEVAAKKLLSSSVEGSELAAEDTLTIHFGAVTPNNSLKKIRRETIALVYDLYQTSDDPKTKLKLVQVLDEVAQTPSNVAYEDDLVEMIKEDIEYLTDIYYKIVFEDDGKMTDNLVAVEKMEQRLYWINENEKLRTEKSEKLRQEILQNEFYQLFRLLVGDPMTYREQEGWNTADQKRAEEISKLIGSIEKPYLEEWSDKLNKIAASHALVDNWQLQTLRFLLQKLTHMKPLLADNLLDKAFKNSLPLKHFTLSFLIGFRTGTQFSLWDKYAKKIVRAQDVQLTSALVYSLDLPKGTDLEESVRDEDLDLLERIVKKLGLFSFLQGQDDQLLHHALINTLARNYKRSPELIEPLFVKEIESNPEHLDMFFRQFPIITMRGWISIQDLTKETVELLKEKMVELPSVDWDVQYLLLEIGKRDGLCSVLDMFLQRIQKDVSRKGRRSQYEKGRYEAIPYHFNPELREFIAQHPKYKEIAGEWIAKMTTEWSIYNWHVGRFLQRIGKGLDEILMCLIEKGDDGSLMRAARVMRSVESTNFDLPIEIVRRTDNEKILSEVKDNMSATGVVWGEYGIAEAFKSKAQMLEKYKNDDNKLVRKFAERMIKSFLKSSAWEYKQSDEEKQSRKIEFEG